MSDSAHKFREFLKAEMKRRDWEQVDLVRETKAAKSTVSRWLDEAEPTAPDLLHLMRLSKVLNVGIETLLSYLYEGQFQTSSFEQLSSDSRLLAERFEQLPKSVRNSILLLMREGIE